MAELWRSEPQPAVSQDLLRVIDLNYLVSDVQVKTERLKERLDKRKIEEKKKEHAKVLEQMRKEQEQ